MIRPAVFLLAGALLSFAADLESHLKALTEGSPLAARSTLGIHVVDLKSGKTLYARNENRFFLPASNMKLATSAAALLHLGPDYRFTTKLVREPSGDLVLVGSGDPSLSGRVYPYRKAAPAGDPLRAIEEIAGEAVAQGLRHVDGDVVGDDRLYPWDPYAPSWTQDDALNSDGAPVSALTVADNTIAIDIRHGPQPGDPALLSFTPPLEYFAIDNRVSTVAGTGPAAVHLARSPGTRQLLISGTVTANGPSARLLAAVDDPALFAACALYDALARRGVSIYGRPVARHRSASEDEAAAGGEVLATRTSPPLRELLQMAGKVSQNLHAELLLRETGRVAKHSGTREAGRDALAALLAETGASPEDFRLEDGSGLSRNAQLTPRLVTGLLNYMYRSDLRDAWMSLLPVGGEDGTLANRLCCTSDAHNIQAKTGTLARAIALSGYADSKTRGMLVFSILVNNFSAPASEVRAWVDKMALALVE
jgi:D-alanyl-D-alanine carboxypeptidase/D-alanyl-D-alanine-endopeptidase (penicillin-binding protein 4)